MKALFWIAALLVVGLIVYVAARRWLRDPNFLRGW